jgi:hypothetical protein
MLNFGEVLLMEQSSHETRVERLLGAPRGPCMSRDARGFAWSDPSLK